MKLPRLTRPRLALILLLATIVLAHIGLWSSDRVPSDLKLRLTVINALGWSIVLLPAYGVSKWAQLRRHAQKDRR